MKTKLSTLLLFLLILTNNVFSQNNESSNSELYLWLKSLPDIEVTPIKADNIFTEAYEIFITQPIDHNNPDGPKFKEQLFLSHVDKNKPMVIELDGYTVNNRTDELSRLLHCNQIMVEHRYFGESVPAPFDWKYLTIEQAADDHHKIIELFKQFYKDKWITTGISKGGSCAIFHRYFYPDDADVSVPYVGPLNTSTEDERVYEWIKTVSTPECREKVFNFQKLCYEKRDELYPIFLKNAEDKKLKYNIVGAEKAYEYAVLEYSFAFWQWGRNNCSEIPDDNSSLEEIWDHLLANGGVSYFSDGDIVEGYPFFYQCYTEFGYYAYQTEQFKDYLKFADGHTPFFIPPGSYPTYNPKLLKAINWWAMNDAKNCIFIYGGNDPWTAPGVCLSGKTNSLKMVNPSGSHSTSIKNFFKDDKELIYSRLEEWLDIKIEH
ncbi:MAG: S28 family serine protease [Ignavibacteriota bacterium]